MKKYKNILIDFLSSTIDLNTIDLCIHYVRWVNF